MKSNFLYEIEHYNPSSATLETLRVSTQGFITLADDVPASTPYPKRIRNGGAGDFSTFMFNQGATFGRSTVAAGEIILSNVDRKYDALRDHDFRKVTIKRFSGLSRGKSLNDAELVATLDVENVELTWSEMRIVILDRIAAIDVQAQTQTFAGDNADAFDIEGDSSTAGQVKPFLVGRAGWFEPTLVNGSSLLYIINHDSDGNPAAVQSIDGVKDNGVSLTFHQDYASIAALVTAQQAGDIPSGFFGTCLTEGAFALNNIINSGTITCKATEGATAADRTAAQCARRVVTRFSSFTSSDFEGVAALDAANDSEVGRYIDDSATILDVAQFFAGSVAGFFVPTINGKFRLGRIVDPVGEVSIRTFTQNQIIRSSGGGLERIGFTDESGGIPTHKTIVNYQKFERTLSESEVAGSVTIEEKQNLGREYRQATAEDETVLSSYAKSEPIEFFTGLFEQVDAEALAIEQLNLRKTWRDQWLAPVEMQYNYDLGDVVTLKAPAFDMQDGKKFVILGKEYNLNNETIEYSLYG